MASFVMNFYKYEIDLKKTNYILIYETVVLIGHKQEYWL